MSSEEQTKSYKLKKISEETESMLEDYTNFLVSFKLKHQETHSNNQSNLQKEIDDIRNEITNEKLKSEKLELRKKELQALIQSERTSFSVESQELVDKKSVIANLELKKESLIDQISKLDAKLVFINKKQSIFEEKKNERFLKIEQQAKNFRKYLGIDIKPEMTNVIKIEFQLKIPCFVMVDVAEVVKVIEITPQVLSFEEVQNVFEELGCFYEFCKFLRKLFVKNIE